jgi:hypothetical protein
LERIEFGIDKGIPAALQSSSAAAFTDTVRS